MENLSCITLALINDVSVNLSGLYVRVSQHILDGIDIGIAFQLKSCKCMATAMESDRLRKEKQTEED